MLLHDVDTRSRTIRPEPAGATRYTTLAPQPLDEALRTATVDLERALLLVTAPPRPSFMGHTPLQTAVGVLGSAATHLADVLAEASRLPDGRERSALTRHLAQAISSTVEVRGALHEFSEPGAVAPSPAQLQTSITMLEDALAHARMSAAVLAGEP